MLALDQLQRRMCSAVRGRHEPELRDLVEGDRIAPEARLRIYRNHAILTLTEALKATYPVVCRLVDERFFAYAAHEFIGDALPSKPCLSDYGDSFPEFLASFPPCSDLVYLADVARLEWAVNMALHAPDAAQLHRSVLESPDAILALHPSLHLVASRWPIHQIWRANQPDGDPETEINLADGGAQLLLYNRGDRVVITVIDDGEYAFLSAIADGAGPTQAATAGGNADPIFDPAATLDFLSLEGLIVQPAPSTAPGDQS